ncbi:hypothetical protein V493_05638 [Pseudogymnoascus sp. VKM F-4281 (FW-2241)]|nr:hypothetical protein V493_05638 [Pseudogymnoascus sp. VKM F-4281 (FW-2241)]
MPLEVFLQISSYLSTPDLGSLRRTCKHAEASLSETFAREFFSKRQFMRSETSLQVLIDISNHQKFSQYLSHVIIGLDSFENRRNPTNFGQTAHSNRYEAGLADERALLSMGQDREMLAQAFRNLPNLQTVGLRDYSSGGRVRDNCRWHSYGVPTIFQETGIWLGDSGGMLAGDEQTQFVSRAFFSIIYALGQSGARPQAFEVLLGKQSPKLHYDAFKIPNFFEPAVTPVLSSLKTLLLAIGPASRHDNETDDDPDVEYPDFALRQYLCHTSNLTHLRINFQSQRGSNPQRFMAWLGRPLVQIASLNSTPVPLLPKSPDPVALSHLRRLDIGMLTISPRVLIAIVHKFKTTLRSLSLWKIDLKPEDQHRRVGERPSAWPKFFAQLSDLDYLSVGCIGQVLRTRHQRIGFKLPAGQTGTPDLTRVCSRSGDMVHFLNNLVSDAVVNWPGGDSLSDDDSMSDDYDDSDTDMDDDE